MTYDAAKQQSRGNGSSPAGRPAKGRRKDDWLMRPGLRVAILAAPAMGKRAGRRSKVVRGNDEMPENSACLVVGTDSA
jgi:hypothetical protein